MSLRLVNAAAAAVLAAASTAHATSMTMQGSYSAVAAAANPTYAPYINDDGGPFLSSPFSIAGLTVGVPTAEQTFLQISPQSESISSTQMGAIDVVLTLLGPNGSAVTGISTSSGGNTATLSNGKISFYANYSLVYSNQTDCLVWNASSCTPTGTTTGALGETITADFADGAVLAIKLYNFADWNMAPQINFELMSGVSQSVPEPETLAVFGSAITGLVMLRRRGRGAERSAG
jgi:hypothetical protein